MIHYVLTGGCGIWHFSSSGNGGSLSKINIRNVLRRWFLGLSDVDTGQMDTAVMNAGLGQ